MKNLLFIFFSFLTPFISICQDIEFKEYSYAHYSFSELFDMIENETDTIFVLSNALIIYNPETDSRFLVQSEDDKSIYPDSDTILVDKEIQLINVHNQSPFFRNAHTSIYKVKFSKKTHFKNCSNFGLYQCVFSANVRIEYDSEMPVINDWLIKNLGLVNYHFSIENCTFQDGVSIRSDSEKLHSIQAGIENSQIWLEKGRERGASFILRNLNSIWLDSNTFHGEGEILINAIGGINRVSIQRNVFNNQLLRCIIQSDDEMRSLNLEKNSLQKPVILSLYGPNDDHNIEWDQFSNKLINGDKYGKYYYSLLFRNFDAIPGYIPDFDRFSNKNIDHYLNRVRIEILDVFRAEMNLHNKLHSLYKDQNDSYNANNIYVEMKDLETERLAFLNRQNPSFDTYFTLKINQFLKVFSAYGTRPAKAIIFSMYVILFFAFIYLFFPNTWDAHGRNRIIDRYTFFMKYMRRKAGIHEVYMEDKKEELLTYEKFKEFVESSEHEVPKIFTATALPLYKWAVSGTRISSAFLKRVDIMKGTWSELPSGKRWWKGILLTGAFTIAIFYDIIIKMLNALMLSINTFTTLGFGEIPIKGLPRYLAIIEGFIGWFMLTIFSVSLISQLLN